VEAEEVEVEQPERESAAPDDASDPDGEGNA
jgi:hypothetical protein